MLDVRTFNNNGKDIIFLRSINIAETFNTETSNLLDFVKKCNCRNKRHHQLCGFNNNKSPYYKNCKCPVKKHRINCLKNFLNFVTFGIGFNGVLEMTYDNHILYEVEIEDFSMITINDD